MAEEERRGLRGEMVRFYGKRGERGGSRHGKKV